MKTCKSCKEIKTLDRFGSDKNKKDLRNIYCKSCVNIKSNLYRVNNPEKRNKTVTTYRLNNREKCIAATKKCHSKDPAKHLAKCAKYRKENPDKRKIAHSNWHKKNPESAKIYKHNRRALKLNASGRISKGITERLSKLQKGKCACCLISLSKVKPHLDHIIPLSKGGSNDDYNIQILCSKCNLSKHSIHPIDFMQSIGFLI